MCVKTQNLNKAISDTFSLSLIIITITILLPVCGWAGLSTLLPPLAAPATTMLHCTIISITISSIIFIIVIIIVIVVIVIVVIIIDVIA